MIDKLETYGQFTYRGAWALEIIAASMGLPRDHPRCKHNASDSAVPIEAVLMAIPFVMVAFAEPTTYSNSTIRCSSNL